MSATTVINELGTERISKLLKHYAIPSIIAMTASSLYNMIDSIFIGHGVGNFALAGLALTFPLMNLGAAFGSLVGIGASALISMLLGQKNYDVANKVLGNVISLNFIMGTLYMAIVLYFLDPILFFFGASENTLAYAKEYMQIIALGNIVTHMYFGLNSVQRASGFPKQAMIARIFTVIINTFLDPIFIYVFNWGIAGAAIATILAQFIALVWIVISLSDKNKVIHFKSGIYKLKSRIVKDILAIGASPFFMNLAACLVVIIINQGLKQHGGDLAIGAYGIVNRVAFVAVMIIMGINQGMQPIVGYNYGAKNFDRVRKTLFLTIAWASTVSIFAYMICQLFPKAIVGVFTSDAELSTRAIEGMKIVFMFFPIVGFQMVTSNFFQSIGMAGKSIFLSLTRQVLLLIPMLLILPSIFGVNGVWYSMPFSDLISSFISLGMLIYQMKLFKKLSNKQQLNY